MLVALQLPLNLPVWRSHLAHATRDIRPSDGEHVTCACAGADVNLSDCKGVTALISSAAAGYAACVELLLSAGANPDAKCSEGRTALIAAARRNRCNAVPALLAAGAHVDVHDSYGMSAMMDAAHHGAVECVQHMLHHGVSPDRIPG